MSDRKPYYEEFADKIIDALEKGTAPWQKPWNGLGPSTPHNPVTGTVYRGINQLMLSMHPEAEKDPRFITFKNALDKGYKVKKGSKSMPIVYWSFHKDVPRYDDEGKPVLDENGKQEKIRVRRERPLSSYTNVFHASQIEGMPELEVPEVSWDPNERGEAILANSGAEIHHDQRDRAYFNPIKDDIHLPPKGAFDSEKDYYATALHELAHWTGHESRLNRNFGPKGSAEYAQEELKAEIASWMVGAETGIGHRPDQHAAYVKSWVKKLREDPYEIVRAAQTAEQIKSVMLGFEKGQSIEETLQSKPERSTTSLPPETEKNPPVKGKRPAPVTEHNAPEQAEPHRASAREYLDVPYIEKAKAKAAGARWDKQARKWFAPEGADLNAFAQWRQKNASKNTVMEMDSSADRNAQAENANRTTQVNTQKTYLAVPYKEKNEAKAAGARWDKREKLWFAPKDSDLTAFQKWLPKERQADNAPRLSPEQEFAAAITAAGLDLRGLPVMDGKLHRVPLLDGKPGTKDGAYMGALDGVPAGFIQNHRTGEKENWKATGYALTAEEREALKVEGAQRREKREAELQEARQRAAKRSFARWKNAAGWAPDTQPYLKEKGVKSFGVKVNENGELMIPARDTEGRIHSMQTVNENGKFFEHGGQKKGMFHLVDGDRKLESTTTICIAEGYATAASAHMATGVPVAAAFDAGNLEAVAKALHEKHPDKQIIILADDDHKHPNNPGLTKGQAAAKAVGGQCITPKFTDAEKAKGLTDFNDLHQSRGLKAVSSNLGAALERAKRQARSKSPAGIER